LFAAYAKFEIFGNALGHVSWRSLALVSTVKWRMNGAWGFAAVCSKNSRLSGTFRSISTMCAQRHINEGLLRPSSLFTGNKPFLRVLHYLLGILGWSVNDGIFSKLSKALWKSIVLPDGAYVLHDEICIYAMYGVAAENWLA
jgi:hypothetical protein